MVESRTFPFARSLVSMRSAVDDRFYRDAGRRVMSCVRLWTSYQAGQGWVLEGSVERSCERFYQ